MVLKHNEIKKIVEIESDIKTNLLVVTVLMKKNSKKISFKLNTAELNSLEYFIDQASGDVEFVIYGQY